VNSTEDFMKVSDHTANKYGGTNYTQILEWIPLKCVGQSINLCSWGVVRPAKFSLDFSLHDIVYIVWMFPPPPLFLHL
jgi:hypothetical protein